MISPINIATQGLLNSPLAVAAVRGRLIIPVSLPGGSSKGLGGLEHPKYYTVTPEKLEDIRIQLEREDDEILAVIMAAMEVLQ